LILVGGLIWASVSGWHRYAAHRAGKRAASAAAAITPTQPQLHALAPSATPAAPPSAGDPAANAPAAAAAAAASSAPPASQRLNLAISTSASTRVRVVADSRVLLDSRLPSGATRHLSAKNQFNISATHPAAVLLEMNGQAMPPLTSVGPSGTMVLSQKDLRQAPSGNAQR